uniref:RING-type domain-containing protein n=2 Tax=Eptatretus burgeri TaxID=7764 RepID=A0A8C4WXD9_EPTBU
MKSNPTAGGWSADTVGYKIWIAVGSQGAHPPFDRFLFFILLSVHIIHPLHQETWKGSRFRCRQPNHGTDLLEVDRNSSPLSESMTELQLPRYVQQQRSGENGRHLDGALHFETVLAVPGGFAYDYSCNSLPQQPFSAYLEESSPGTESSLESGILESTYSDLQSDSDCSADSESNCESDSESEGEVMWQQDELTRGESDDEVDSSLMQEEILDSESHSDSAPENALDSDVEGSSWETMSNSDELLHDFCLELSSSLSSFDSVPGVVGEGIHDLLDLSLDSDSAPENALDSDVEGTSWETMSNSDEQLHDFHLALNSPLSSSLSSSLNSSLSNSSSSSHHDGSMTMNDEEVRDLRSFMHDHLTSLSHVGERLAVAMELMFQYLETLMESDTESESRPPASEDLIHSLPQVYFGQAHLAQNQNCIICCNEFNFGDAVTNLPCLHLFHTACIDSWLQRSATCPVCRYHLVDCIDLRDA